MSPGGGKIVSLVVGLGGTVVPVLASPFSGVWGAKIVELGDSACWISGAHGAGMGACRVEGCLAFGCQEGCASQRLGPLENVWAGRYLEVTVGSECLWMVLGGMAVDGALSPEMFLQAPPSLLPGIGYPQLFLSKPSPAQAAMRDVKQPLPRALGFPPPSQVEDGCLQHVAPVKAKMDGS